MVEGRTATLGVEAIDALLATRAGGTRIWRNVLGTLLLYHSAVNYTMHGYGDIQVRPERHADR